MISKNSAVGVVAGLLLAGLAGQAFAGTVYSNIPAVLDHNYPSLGYQATQTDEFGDRINLAGTDRGLTSITVTLSSWARSEDYGFATSFSHDLTLNVYDAGSGLLPGALLGTITQNFSILYRPVGWDRNGIAQNVTFDFTSLGLVLPNSIVVGLAYNTQTYGANPIGSDGPYNSLNFAVNDAVGGGITVGSNDDLDDVMWDTATAGWYADGGAGGVGIFRRDTNWTGYAPMIQVETVAVPLPTSALMGFGLLGLAAFIRRRKAQIEV